MGNETILYYVTEESITGTANYIKKYFWQKIKFASFVMEKEDITMIALIIPSLKKEWKPEKLFKLMQESAEGYSLHFPDAEIILHPQVERMLGRQKEQDTFSHIYWFLAERLLADIFGRQHEKRNKKGIEGGNRRKYEGSRPASVVLLLGNLFFPEEQMQKFIELMQPYFPRINRLFILYDMEEDESSNGAKKFWGAETEMAAEVEVNAETETEWEAETEAEIEWKIDRFEEAIQHDTEELYYEYGFVSQIQCQKGSALKRCMVESGQNPVLFVDCGYPGGIPFAALKKGDFYLDIVSDEKKESLFGRKYMEISYVSPRKYLDTLVKSGYDK